MFNVYQPWDPLEVCIVGRSYGPEFYSWIQDPKLRSIFEKVAVESEEDFQSLIAILKKFNVEVLRPDLPLTPMYNGVYQTPPMLPRDNITMIGNTLYENSSFDFKSFYNNVKDPKWPVCSSLDDFYNLPIAIQNECVEVHGMQLFKDRFNCYNNIISYVRTQGNAVKSHIRDDLDLCNRAQIVPAGYDYFVGTWNTVDRPSWATVTQKEQQEFIDTEFPYTKNHIFDTQGHLDSSFTIVKPGLIISDQLDYGLESVFKDWEILKFSQRTTRFSKQFLDQSKINVINKNLKTYTYLIDGFDQDPTVSKFVEEYLLHWIGNSAETTFAVNLLSIDENNVIMFGGHDEIADTLARHGVTAHVINLRHSWFWDGGIHCLTSDLHRRGTPKSLFGSK